MAHKPLLHELLREDQEPFHLKTYITNKRSQLRTDTALQIRRRRPLLHENPSKPTNLCKHACFFSFNASPDVRRSPFPDLPSPAKSPCKSPNAAVFLHIPSRTAALLVEAAMRIQKQQQQQQVQRSKPRAQPRTGFGLLGSLLKRLKDRSKNRKRAISECDFNKVSEDGEIKVGESVGVSCSYSNRRPSGADWTENHACKSLDFEASTSSRASELSEEIGGGEFFIGDDGTCYCSSPFRFSLQQSPSSTGRRTPDFRSPSASPSRRLKQEKEKLDNVQGEEEEEKEQCSPVSVLDPPFDEEDEHESRDAGEDDKEGGDDEEEDDDDYDMECSYENVQRAKQQLLHRLRRFEMLAELDPVELERKLLEGSDDEGQVELDGDEPVLNQSNFKYNAKIMSADMKRLVSDLIVEEKREMFQSCGNDVVMGRIRNRLDSWKGVEFDTIDMMIALDFKKESDSWAKFSNHVEETAAEIEVAIYVQIIEELTEDLGV